MTRTCGKGGLKNLLENLRGRKTHSLKCGIAQKEFKANYFCVENIAASK
jgi:hypothetical protein